MGAIQRRRLAAVPAVLLLLAVASLGCAKGKRAEPGQFLTARQIYDRAMRELQQDRLRQAQSMLEQISYSDEDRTELEPRVRLAIADATFYQGYGVSLIDARSLYQDFVALYGDHALAPYAQFQTGVCSLKQVVHPSRDQGQTHQAISDLRVVGDRWPGSRFGTAAERMIHEAQHYLAEHEFMVGKFYLNRKSPVAAIRRFETILDRYPSYGELDKVYFYLSRAELATGNDVEARIYLDKLVSDFPDGRFSDEARKQLSKAGGGLERLDLGGD